MAFDSSNIETGGAEARNQRLKECNFVTCPKYFDQYCEIDPCGTQKLVNSVLVLYHLPDELVTIVQISKCMHNTCQKSIEHLWPFLHYPHLAIRFKCRLARETMVQC